MIHNADSYPTYVRENKIVNQYAIFQIDNLPICLPIKVNLHFSGLFIIYNRKNIDLIMLNILVLVRKNDIINVC